MTAMAQKKARKAGIQPGSKKFPKILAIPATADEMQATYKFTPAEIRYVRRILAEVERKYGRTAK